MSLQKGDIYHGTGSSQSLIGNVIHGVSNTDGLYERLVSIPHR